MISFKFYRGKNSPSGPKRWCLSFQKLLFEILHLPFLRISAAVMCSVMSDSATSWTAAGQASLSMRFFRQKYWSGLPFPSPGSLFGKVLADGLNGKESTCNSGDLGSIPPSGRSPREGNGHPLQLQSMGLQRVRHHWGTNTYTSGRVLFFISWN